MDDSRRLVQNTTIYALGDIIPKVLVFITFPILTTYLTPEDYGILNYVTTLTSVLMVLGLLCLNTYYLVFYYKQKDAIAQKRLLGNLSVSIVIINAILVLLVILFGKSFFNLIGSNVPFSPYIIIGVLTHFFSIFSVLPSALYRVQERPLPLVILSVLRGIIRVVCIVIFVKYYGYGAKGVLNMDLIITAVFSTIFLYITLKNSIICFDTHQISHALKFSFPLLPGTIAYFVISASDRFLIDHYLTLTDLGIFGTASSLAYLLNIFSNGAYKAFEPYFFKTYDTSGFVQNFVKIRDLFVYLMLIGALGLALFSREFFEIFSGPQFHRAYIFVPPLVLGVFYSSYNLLYSTIVTAKEKTKINSLVTILGGCLSVGLNVLLMPHLGLMSASIVSGITFIFMNIALRYYTGLKDSQLRIILSLVFISILTFVSVYVFNVEDFILRLVIKSFLFIVACLCLIPLMDIDIRNFFQLLKKK